MARLLSDNGAQKAENETEFSWVRLERVDGQGNKIRVVKDQAPSSAASYSFSDVVSMMPNPSFTAINNCCMRLEWKERSSMLLSTVLKSSYGIECYRKSQISVGVNTGHGNTHVNVSKGGVSVSKGHKGKPVVVTVKPGKNPFFYKYATSDDQLHDFARYKLGSHVKALATEVNKETLKQQYTIAPGVHKLASTKSVACHSENYVYAVYYYHETSDTSAYVVPLVGEDKTREDVVAVCRKDMSQWNPKHVAFKVLKVKPGSVPICHFIPEDHIVWVQN